MLDNRRQELFAQALAQGKSQNEAYAAAGYKPSDQNASRLTRDDKVKARVDELRSRIVENVVLTREWVIERLIANADAAGAREDGSVVNRALELLGKEIGMFVDRSENTNVTHVISSDPLDEQAWTEEHVTAH